MKNERLFDKKIFSPEFLMKLKTFHGITTERAITVIAGGWGGCTINEAEGALTDLRESLMRMEKGNEYPSDYAGDRTFAIDVDEIIEDLRSIVRSLRGEELSI